MWHACRGRGGVHVQYIIINMTNNRRQDSCLPAHYTTTNHCSHKQINNTFPNNNNTDNHTNSALHTG